MVFSTRGIVLKSIKYGETSLIVSIFTEMFGIQSYLLNGIRKSGKLSSNIAMFQASSLLDLNVYHYELKNLQRIKEYKWSYLYSNILTDIIKNAVAMYMVELLQKCLKQPEPNLDLFEFCEDAFIYLDKSDSSITANFPLYFSIHLAHFFGFRLNDNYSKNYNILDLQEGAFTNINPTHGNILDGKHSFAVSQILKAQHPNELNEIKMNREARKEILNSFQYYYGYHVQDFGSMKSMPIIQAILS